MDSIIVYLQIARRALRARYIGDQRGLLLAQLEQLLALPKHGLFDRVEFALDRLQRRGVLVVVCVHLCVGWMNARGREKAQRARMKLNESLFSIHK